MSKYCKTILVMVFFSNEHHLLTKTLHSFSKNFNIPQWVSPWEVFNRTPEPFL